MTATHLVPHTLGTLPHTPGAPVVVYVRAVTFEAVEPEKNRLREIAEDRGLAVVAMFHDIVEESCHRGRRRQWAYVTEYINGGHARGFLCSVEDDVAPYAEDKLALRRWVHDKDAFAVFPDQAADMEHARTDG